MIGEAARVRMVVLPPESALPSRSAEENSARTAIRDFITARGAGAPRIARNTLAFLASRSDEIRGLRRAARRLHAWDSILNGERRVPNLAGERRAQASASLRIARRDMDAGLVRAYKWAVSPNQLESRLPEYGITESETDADSVGEIVESAFREPARQEALVKEYPPSPSPTPSTATSGAPSDTAGASRWGAVGHHGEQHLHAPPAAQERSARLRRRGRPVRPPSDTPTAATKTARSKT